MMPQIVLIDDDPLVRDSFARLLEADGYVAFCFASAEDFLDAAPQDSIDCLIVDHRLPGRTGAELLQQLRASRIRIPAIVLSGTVDESEQQLLRTIPDARLLCKPCHADELFELVGAICQPG